MYAQPTGHSSFLATLPDQSPLRQLALCQAGIVGTWNVWFRRILAAPALPPTPFLDREMKRRREDLLPFLETDPAVRRSTSNPLAGRPRVATNHLIAREEISNIIGASCPEETYPPVENWRRSWSWHCSQLDWWQGRTCFSGGPLTRCTSAATFAPS